MCNERYYMVLFDGGFSFEDEYIPPIWAIADRDDRFSPVCFLEFHNEEKEVCNELIRLLNNYESKIHSKNTTFNKFYDELEEENEKLKELLKCADKIILSTESEKSIKKFINLASSLGVDLNEL